MDPAVAHGFFTSADPLKAFASDKLLWGSMAATDGLERVLRAAVARVDGWLEKRARA
jgi:D-arabinitol 4-dehydrogenase